MIGLVMAVRNRIDLTLQAIASIPPDHRQNLIIVDDGSVDGTREWLNSSSTHWLDGKDRPGISAKWNMGIERHMAREATHVAVLNNDILLSPVTIAGLLERISRPKTFVAVAHNIKGQISPAQALSYAVQVDEDVVAPDWGAFMLSRECWEKVGPFDEGFIGVDFEDVDYMFRTEKAGGLCVATRLAPYYHFVGGSKTVRGPEVFALHQANRAYFERKWNIKWPI